MVTNSKCKWLPNSKIVNRSLSLIIELLYMYINMIKIEKKKIWKKSILSSNENSFLIKNAMKNEGKNLINSKLCILNKLVLYDFIEKRIPVKVLEVSNRKTRPSYLPCTAWGPEQTAPTAQCDFGDSLLTAWTLKSKTKLPQPYFYLQFIVMCDLCHS